MFQVDNGCDNDNTSKRERKDYSTCRNSFAGFTDYSRSESILEQMRDIVAKSRRQVEEGRRRSRNFRLEVIRNLSQKSNTSISTIGEKSVDEALDILTELPQSTPRRVLRSQGSVDSIPHVQSRILEYKHGKL